MSSSSDLETSIAQQIIRKRRNRPRKGANRPPSSLQTTGETRETTLIGHMNLPEAPCCSTTPLMSGSSSGTRSRTTKTPRFGSSEPQIRYAIKAKHLNGFEIDPPSLSQTTRVGCLTRKTTSYDVWSIGDDDAEVAGGEELRGLSCLLPRKRKKGKLYIGKRHYFFIHDCLFRSYAPSALKHVSHHIVISTQPPIATALQYQPVVYQNTPHASYPKDMLKHSFVPYGARSEQSRSGDMSIDADDGETAVGKPS
ncbi:hypothetical protein J3R82DRAFT_5194 [Butyriboletus roseoflavus]|nr:hypothetical protein J3R82DRAFT_5194 [Butyriboletus roseoflavus]